MSSPEHSGERNVEQEPVPYHRSSRFTAEQLAGQAYFQAQEAIFEQPDCDLSVYRLQLSRIWHVAVLGETPARELSEHLEAILAAGEAVILPSTVLKLLADRRSQQMKRGSWVERHYRSSK